MDSLKTISGIQVLEHNLSRHVRDQLDIDWSGSTFAEYGKSKNNVSLAILKWPYRREDLNKKN